MDFTGMGLSQHFSNAGRRAHVGIQLERLGVHQVQISATIFVADLIVIHRRQQVAKCASRDFAVKESCPQSSPPIWGWLMAALTPALAVMIAAVLPAYRASIVNPVTVMADDR